MSKASELFRRVVEKPPRATTTEIAQEMERLENLEAKLADHAKRVKAEESRHRHELLGLKSFLDAIQEECVHETVRHDVNDSLQCKICGWSWGEYRRS